MRADRGQDSSRPKRGEPQGAHGASGGRDKKAREREAAREPRDFTNKIKIGGEVFDILIEHKKKFVDLPWPVLKIARERIDRESIALYKGMRGRVLLGHRRLLDGEKLEVILKIAPWLDPEGDLAKSWPRNVNFAVSEESDRILASLSHVLQIAEWRKESSELGFVTLFADGEGAYWFRVSRGFHTALNESLASLESLTDDLGDSAPKEGREGLSTLYRRLQSFFE